MRPIPGGSTITRAGLVRALLPVLSPVRSPVLVAVLALLAPAVAHAQSPSDKALAEALFRDGRSLFNEGKVDEACAKLEGSYRIEAKTGTLTNLAACHELQGKTASAWAEFSEAAAQAANAHRASIEQISRARAAALETKLSRLAIRLTDPDPKTEVTIDGRRIVLEALGTPIPLDPGVHKVVAKLGDATWSREETIAAGPASVQLTIPKLLAVAPAPVIAPPVVAPPPPTAPPSSVSSTSMSRGVATYGALGVGVIGLGVGTVFGVLTLAKKSDADALCRGSVCSSQQGVDLEEEARGTATVSTIGLGVGIVGAVVGLYLLATAPKSSSTGGAVSPSVTASGSGIAGRF